MQVKQLAKLAVSYRAVTLTAFIALTYLGISSYQSLPRREMPSIPVPIAQIITMYPGASTLDVETFVTKKLEQKLSEITDVKIVSSTSKPGISIILVELVYGRPTKENWDKMRNKVEEARSELPSTIQGPLINDEFSDTASLLLAVTGKDETYPQLKTYAKQIRDRLKRISSVGKVDMAGEQDEVIHLYGRVKTTAKNLPNIWRVAGSLRSKNIIYPGASLYPKNTQVKLKTTGRIQKAEELGKIILSRDPKSGKVVMLQDLYNIERTLKRPKHLIRYEGKKAIVLSVTMRPGLNVIKMGEKIDKALLELKSALPKSIQLAKVSDQPQLVDESISNFMVNLFQAIAIVLFVAMLFMGFRTGLLMAIAIPLSMLISFWIMKLIGWDLQQISIAALIIALGMLVDNAIVITDNIFTKLEEGYTTFQASWQGAAELAYPVLMSTLTTIAIFFPLALMPSISGDFIRSIPVVVGIVLACSFFVAMTITPLMSYYFLKPRTIRNKDAEESDVETGWMGSIQVAYRGTLDYALAYPKTVLMAALVGFIAMAVGFVLIGKSFFPAAERDMFTIEVSLPDGRSIEATTQVVKDVEALLNKYRPRIKTITSFIGKGAPRFTGGLKQEPQNASYAQLVIRTSSPSVTPGLVAKLNKVFANKIAEASITAEQFKRGPSANNPVELRVYGDDLVVLRQLSTQVKKLLLRIPGTVDVKISSGTKIFNVDVKVDDYRASLVGLDNLTVAKVTQTLLEGYNAGTLLDGDDEIPIVIRANTVFQKRLTILQNAAIPIRAEKTSASAPLLEIATFVPRWDDAIIQRRNNQRYVTISCGVNGVLASTVLSTLRKQLKRLPQVAGYRYEAAGEEEKRSEGFKDLADAMVLGIMLIILLLIIQFNSFRHASIIMMTLPLSMIGAIIGLYVTFNSFGFMSFLGVVSLCGVVVNNAIILLDYVQTRIREGAAYLDALKEAGLRRMRPILLTTLTTVGGLLPLLLTGGAMWNGMAAVLIFGLLVSTLLTLVIVPCFYVILVGDREQKQFEASQEA
ncbi:MAG: hypothetical protein CL920_05050 [Deltaproteobacteria bacterium]|nr:hypothetical protein [Deltaproteobacteria bacterium]MBU48048.1 hypothetical protein [Deltaproteobacteria bacterium]